MRVSGRTGERGSQSERLHNLVVSLRARADRLRAAWLRRMRDTGVLSVMSAAAVSSDAPALYDRYVDALETGREEALQLHTRIFSGRLISLGVRMEEVMAIVLVLRDVMGRFIKSSHATLEELNATLDVYQPAANRIATMIAEEFVAQQERIIREQQEAIRHQSTPVLQVRGRLLIQPIVGVVDPPRAVQLTEQLLRAIRVHRARVAVIDVTGVPVIDSAVANHLVRIIEACRLLGARAIVSGLSPEITRTVVGIGVDLASVITTGDIQSGIEEAERLMGRRGSSAA